MSYTEIYKVDASGDVVLHAETHNSHLGAIHIWSSLFEKYISLDRMKWIKAFSGDGDGMKPLWALAHDERLPYHQRVTLESTFDFVMVARRSVSTVVEAYREFVKDFGPGSLMRQADIFEQLANDSGVLGLCWNQTSVNSNPWQVKCGEDEYRPYNVFVDGKLHWFMFANDKLELTVVPAR